jgi:spore maturation protein CgeB
MFLEPGSEVLVAKDGAEVAEHLKWLSKDRAAQIGRRAFKRIMAQHTYNHRAKELDKILSALARG